MKINEETIKNLDQKGIYSFIFPNNKRYIGSTKKSFIGRLNNHIDKLKSNNHTNEYFQNAYNKYKEDISFEILEIICEDVEKREEYWIDYFKCSEREYGYNIIKLPTKSPSYQKEIKEKISNTLKRKYQSGEILLNKGIFKKGTTPWNKGIKYDSTDHLKVPKKTFDITNRKKNIREKLPKIEVWKNNKLLQIFNSAIELQELSNCSNFILSNYMELRNPDGRNGYSPYFLSSFNINKSFKTGKQYKGLNFKHQLSAPLCCEA